MIYRFNANPIEIAEVEKKFYNLYGITKDQNSQSNLEKEEKR